MFTGVSFEAIIAIGLVLIVVGALVFGFIMAVKGGKASEKINEAKEDANDAKKQVEALTAPNPSPAEQLAVFERLRNDPE